MVEATIHETSTDAARRPSRFHRPLARTVIATGIVIGVLASGAPSWAGPMMGC